MRAAVVCSIAGSRRSRLKYLNVMWQDLTYAIRRLRRASWVSAGIILLIAVGISANTLIFSFADAFLWRNLPVREPQTLIQFFEIYPNIRPQTFFDYALYQRVADESALLTDVIGQYEFTVPLETNSGPERIYAQGVTDNFFSGLGLRLRQAGAFVATMTTWLCCRTADGFADLPATLLLSGDPFAWERIPTRLSVSWPMVSAVPISTAAPICGFRFATPRTSSTTRAEERLNLTLKSLQD